jgi:Peptidase C39 family
LGSMSKVRLFTTFLISICFSILYAHGQLPKLNGDVMDIQEGGLVRPGLIVPKRFQLERSFQSGKQCGPNSLYFLLRLNGVDVKYDDVAENIAAGEKGSSFLQLQECAKRFGVDTESRTDVSPDELSASVLPAVVHFEAIGKERSDSAPSDHFVLVIKQNGNGTFAGIDTTEMLVIDYSSETLARNMSGNVLFVTKSPRLKERQIERLLIGLWIVAASFWVVNITAMVRRWRASVDDERRTG